VKPILPIALSLLSASNLLGDGTMAMSSAVPERPGIPVAYVGGQRLVIVGYKGNDPVVLSNGARVTVHDARVSIIPGETFAPGVVTVDSAESISQTNTQQVNGEYSKQQYNIFYGKLTADRDLSDVYLLLLEFEDLNGDYSGAPKVAILGTAIGRMEAGVKKTVNADFPPLLSKRHLYWGALVFSGGVEVRGGAGVGLLDSLFDMVDHVGLQKAIAERASGNHQLMIYRRFPLKFGEDLKGKYAGQTVRLDVSVSPSGQLDYVKAEGSSGGDLAREVARQLGWWLFLPRVKDGEPQEGDIIMPIKF